MFSTLELKLGLDKNRNQYAELEWKSESIKFKRDPSLLTITCDNAHKTAHSIGLLQCTKSLNYSNERGMMGRGESEKKQAIIGEKGMKWRREDCIL